MDAGQRNRLIVIQRATPTVDDHGGETMAWAELAQAWARVRFGTGQERRGAAQERADQAAVFEVLWTPTLATATEKDRISFAGAYWDINSLALVGLNEQIHFTATRSA